MNTPHTTSAQILALIADLEDAIRATERRIGYLAAPRAIPSDTAEVIAAAQAALNPEAGQAVADELRTLSDRLADQRRALRGLTHQLERQRVRERMAVDAAFADRRAALRRKTAEAAQALAAALAAEDAIDLEQRIAGGNGAGVAEFAGVNAAMLAGHAAVTLADLSSRASAMTSPSVTPAAPAPRPRLRKLSDAFEGEPGIVE